MDAFIYKLAIIFIPGIMGRFLLGRLLFIRKNDKFYFTLAAFLFGVSSYVIFDLFTFFINPNSGLFSVTAAVFDVASADPIKIFTLLWVTLISIILSTLWAFVEKKRYLMDFFQKLGLTSRLSGADVWNDLLNSQDVQNNPWITLRDRKNDLLYQGNLRAFSDMSTVPELVISQVIVYRISTGEEEYSANLLYLSIEPGRIEIECLPELQNTMD